MREKLALEIPADSQPWKGLVLHHSASPDGQIRDWDGIRKYHTSYRVDFKMVTKVEFMHLLEIKDGTVFQGAWSDIGYHWGVERVENQLQAIPGRPMAKIGAHSAVKGASGMFNVKYIGFCVVGNYDVSAPDKELWEFCLKAVRTFMEHFRFPSGHVIGHREVFQKLGVPVQKSCPGKAWNMETFRRDL